MLSFQPYSLVLDLLQDRRPPDGIQVLHTPRAFFVRNAVLVWIHVGVVKLHRQPLIAVDRHMTFGVMRKLVSEGIEFRLVQHVKGSDFGFNDRWRYMRRQSNCCVYFAITIYGAAIAPNAINISIVSR